MNKVAEVSMLLDFYGKLLTQKQYNILDMHCNNDFSLSEISENLNISRQGVFDTLKRAENLLYEYEDKLKLVNKFIEQKNTMEDVLNNLVILKNNKNENPRMLDDAIKVLQSLIDDESN